jgi:hypothetical protein
MGNAGGHGLNLNVFKSAKRPWSYSGGGGVFVPPTLPLGLFTGGIILNYATSGGTKNNLNPGGSWPSAGIGRLNVTTTVSSEIWTGLLASGLPDGYGLLIKIVADGATGNTLQLDSKNSGSSAANQFFSSGNLVLSVGQQALVVYSGGVWDIG